MKKKNTGNRLSLIKKKIISLSAGANQVHGGIQQDTLLGCPQPTGSPTSPRECHNTRDKNCVGANTARCNATTVPPFTQGQCGIDA
ncbi:hypothetical protein [Taibaiella koreensis]|uniref:hypothetical protein n=1 Tax=Taibaiella koreensis TaxID=1268548 RepID=UPI000E599EC4|nr:hypothetical protein [Taibaiella koreensis]